MRTQENSSNCTIIPLHIIIIIIIRPSLRVASRPRWLVMGGYLLILPMILLLFFNFRRGKKKKKKIQTASPKIPQWTEMNVFSQNQTQWRADLLEAPCVCVCVCLTIRLLQQTGNRRRTTHISIFSDFSWRSWGKNHIRSPFFLSFHAPWKEEIIPDECSMDGRSSKHYSVRFTLSFASRRDVEAVSFLCGFLLPLPTLHRDHGPKKNTKKNRGTGGWGDASW